MIDAAIVGLGRWGRTLVEAAQGKSEKIRFTRAVSRDPAQHRAFLETHHLLAGSFGEALADRSIEAIVLATPHTRHVDEVVAAASAGKHVFCEKPLALTRDGTARAIGACRDAGVVLGIGTDKRYFSSIAEVIRLAASGELGPLIQIEGNFSNEVAAAFAAWRNVPEESPAGGMTGTGIHMLDAMMTIGGRVKRVHARLLALKPGPDPWDSLSVLLEFASGVGGTLACVRSTPGFLRLHAFGRNGSAEAVGLNDVVIRKSGAEPLRLRYPKVETVKINLEAFADAVAGRAPNPIPPEHIANVTDTFVAIADAVRTGMATQEV
ncbi:MAG: Gfo/Idh/MocA family oxidoreductase [Alphaproteobacteria bacterium]|nr:Gfo/Idh/MocA family oxidoreductase [Alphaproteobacteria bacterium]MBV9555311.1 Gfo/Idh/MocA family oxidoreductase [Alphaproteobacteria bacterium]